MKAELFKMWDGELEIRLTGERSDVVVFEKSLKLNDNETLWVRIYSDGLARYGLTMECDPLHDNSRYTWSSRASVINKYLLNNEIYKLAISDCAHRTTDRGGFGVFGITQSFVRRIADELLSGDEKIEFLRQQFEVPAYDC